MKHRKHSIPPAPYPPPLFLPFLNTTQLKRTSSSTRTHATRLLSSLYFKANIAELRKRMPIQRTNVNATFKSKGGFNDEVNVQLPKMRSRARSVVDPLKRASEVLSTSYLETYENLEGTAGKTAIRTAGGRLVKPGKRTNNLAVEQVYGRGE